MKEIREESNTELLREIGMLRDELLDPRFQQATGQLTNTTRMKTAKRTIAHIKTMMTECELGSQD